MMKYFSPADRSILNIGLSSALAVLTGSLLLTLSAKIQVPFYPVPMTLQTFALAILCLAYGPRLGVASVLFYLGQGAFGLPVFAGAHAGLPYLFGPTGGYLLGFVPAALLLTYYGSRQRHLKRHSGYATMLTRFFSILLAFAFIYVCGYTWLGALIGYEKAFWAGVVPFVLGDIVKAVLATISITICGPWLARLGFPR